MTYNDADLIATLRDMAKAIRAQGGEGQANILQEAADRLEKALDVLEQTLQKIKALRREVIALEIARVPGVPAPLVPPPAREPWHSQEAGPPG